MLSKMDEEEVPALSPPQNTGKTMIFGGKYLSKNSRIQLRNCNTPDEHKTRKNTLKWIRRVTTPHSKAGIAKHPAKFTWPAVFLSGKRVSEACI